MVTAKKRIENIIKYHHDNEISKVEYNIKKMIEDGYIKIVCNVDTREQLPYTPEEINLPCNTIKNDVGDYNFIIFIDQGEGYKTVRMEAGVIIERKTCQDLYGTLMNRNNRERFYKEIERFHKDESLNQFLIFAECSLAEFYSYVIPSKRRYMQREIQKTLASRRATIAGLRERGVHVCFEGSRVNAVKDVKPAVTQWICKNYKKVFGL